MVNSGVNSFIEYFLLLSYFPTSFNSLRVFSSLPLSGVSLIYIYSIKKLDTIYIVYSTMVTLGDFNVEEKAITCGLFGC